MDQSKKDKYLEELFEVLRIPSMSTKNQNIPEMTEIVRKKLETLGAKTQILQIENSYPYIFGEIGEGDKTLLIYDHYDVQVPEPLDLWESEPFEPTVRDGRIYARGVSDNKAHLILRIQAVRELLEKHEKLPIKIKFLIEGEEEIGSPNLNKLAEKHGHLWKDADICLWETGSVDDEGYPKIRLGMKGILYVELTSKLGEVDLHSGDASLFDSAVWRLVEALSTIRDEKGNVLINGFNDSIVPPNSTDLEFIRSENFDKEKTLKESRRTSFLGNETKKEKILENHYFKPTANICGIWGGFTEEEKIKTIIPKEAKAKIDFRLVKDQDPQKMLELLKNHLAEKGFGDIEVKKLASLPAGKTSSNNPGLQNILKILEKFYGKKPEIILTTGGSGPYHFIASQFDIPVFALGCYNPGSNAHAPNENVKVKDYFRAIEATINLIESL